MVLVLAVVAAVAVVAAGSATAIVRLRSPLPLPAVHVTAPAEMVLAPGTAPPVPSPSGGGFLLADGTGVELAATSADTPRPIASVAKVMTALVALQAHPLDPGVDGPSLTLTQQDAAFYRDELAAGGSVIPVSAGEVLTERQLLLALLLPSANNVADTLAVWVSGTVAAFVTRENSTASALGMPATHFADPTGVSGLTVSTPRDLVRLATAALAVPALAGVVRTQAATLPDGTALRNLDILLATNGDWLGLKTGWTATAGGCLLFAARHTYSGATTALTLYGAVLGQPADASVDADHPELGGAFSSAVASVTAGIDGYTAVDLGRFIPPVSGSVVTPWGARSSAVAQPTHGTVVARYGQLFPVVVSLSQPLAQPPAGTVIAHVRSSASGDVRITWPLATTDDVAGPDWWWHILHG